MTMKIFRMLCMLEINHDMVKIGHDFHPSTGTVVITYECKRCKVKQQTTYVKDCGELKE